jgi:DNA repair exonuclease SbcCD ATPase subunit
LSNEHERLIGIISHVEELSYEINSKINVTKDLNGSHLEVVCD